MTNCPVCKKELKTDRGLRQHMRKYHYDSHTWLEEKAKEDFRSNMIVQVPFTDLEKLNKEKALHKSN